MHLPWIRDTGSFLILTALVFIIVLGRYVLIAWLFYGFFYLWRGDKWKQRKISPKAYKKKQFLKEFTWSMVTALVFAFTGSFSFLLWQHGYTRIYTDVNDYSLLWLPLSFSIALIIHETYYYWLHRFMHHPAVFKFVHKVHHESNITSPWTAFSFHPLEGFLQAIFLPVLLLFLPMHYSIILLMLTMMTFSSVINHLDIEIYPAGFNKHFLGRWLIGATHHALHHKQFKHNYGLYFTFWDKWKKTESPLFE